MYSRVGPGLDQPYGLSDPRPSNSVPGFGYELVSPHLIHMQFDGFADVPHLPSPVALSREDSEAGEDQEGEGESEYIATHSVFSAVRRRSMVGSGDEEAEEGAADDVRIAMPGELSPDGRARLGATLEWANVDYFVSLRWAARRKRLAQWLPKFGKSSDAAAASVRQTAAMSNPVDEPAEGLELSPRGQGGDDDHTEQKMKFLLRKVSGIAKPGELLAVMGSSGSGKTTLLDALSGRLHRHLSGTTTINGMPVPIGCFGGFSKAYVFQGDFLYPSLTVLETLDFSARFQLDKDASAQVRNDVVTRWLKLLGLYHIRDVYVGNTEKKGISGGQMRRLSLGVDLLKDPKIVFLDEPTSGLDSTSAFKVVRAIREMMMANYCTVLMTVHQPSPRMAALFDSTLVLDRGHAIFIGPQPALVESLRLSGRGRVPDGMSPVEYLLDVVDELHEQGWDVTSFMEMESQPRSASSERTMDLGPPARHHRSRARTFRTLCHRLILIIFRTPDLLWHRFVFYTVMGLLVSSMFWGLGTSFDAVNEVASFLLLGMSVVTYSSLDVLPLFALERDIIQREYFQESYGVGTYVTVHATLWTITCIPCSLLWSVTTYWCVGLSTETNGIETFMYYWLIWFCAMFSGNAFCMLLSAAITSAITGISTGAATLDFMLMLGGFFIAKSNIPKYWIWFHYLSHFTYSQAGLMVNYFDNMPLTKFGCPPPDPPAACFLTGKQVLEYFQVDDWNKWLSPMALLCLGLLWRILHIGTLWYKFRKLRSKG